MATGFRSARRGIACAGLLLLCAGLTVDHYRASLPPSEEFESPGPSEIDFEAEEFSGNDFTVDFGDESEGDATLGVAVDEFLGPSSASVSRDEQPDIDASPFEMIGEADATGEADFPESPVEPPSEDNGIAFFPPGPAQNDESQPPVDAGASDGFTVDEAPDVVTTQPDERELSGIVAENVSVSRTILSEQANAAADAAMSLAAANSERLDGIRQSIESIEASLQRMAGLREARIQTLLAGPSDAVSDGPWPESPETASEETEHPSEPAPVRKGTWQPRAGEDGLRSNVRDSVEPLRFEHRFVFVSPDGTESTRTVVSDQTTTTLDVPYPAQNPAIRSAQPSAASEAKSATASVHRPTRTVSRRMRRACGPNCRCGCQQRRR